MMLSSIITPNRSGVNQNPPNFPNTATFATNSEVDPSTVPIFAQRAQALASQLPAYLRREGVEVNPIDLLVEEVEAECAQQEAVEELLFDLRFCGTQACRVTIFTI